MEAAETRSEGKDADTDALLSAPPSNSPTFGDVDILGMKKSARELKVFLEDYCKRVEPTWSRTMHECLSNHL